MAGVIFAVAIVTFSVIGIATAVNTVTLLLREVQTSSRII